MTQHRVHAFTDDALGSHDAVGLVAALHAGEVSVSEVVEAAIARAERVEPQLNAIAHRGYDQARAEAQAPRPGFFAGVPTWVKDNSLLEGMPTRHGTDAWDPAPDPADGDFARMYRAAGAVVLGKSRLPEYGFLPTCEHPRLGPVHCPWDTTRTAGASSAGSAALVAAGVVPIAHANDGGGSIRIPAAVNGLVGLKPTRGRIPTDKLAREQPVQIVADGVVTRSVRDTAAFMREAERIYRPLKLPPIGDLTRPTKARLRIAVQTNALDREASPEVVELTMKTAALLESLGHHVEEASLPVPASFQDDFLLYWATLAMFLTRTGKRVHGPSWLLANHDEFTFGLAAHALRRLPKVPLAIARLRSVRRSAERFFSSYDVHLAPTLASETPVIGHLDPMQDFEVTLDRLLDWMSITPYQNVTGQPAISLPLATTAAGLPHGMMFSAGAGREGRLIELAYELEEASPFASIQA
ncbi:amidase [Nocardioides sp.]|uniref:amidase n=1 Tax=Nocardioides sp. TaxID=35761 RepID=UPI001A31864F|nr:amidase [Nocardioides sp.]MBJ7358911.1 amidase [Nocardioides sp.]